MITIPKNHFNNTIKKYIIINTKINNKEEFLYSNEDNDNFSDKEYNKLYLKIEKLKEKRNNYFSMYSLVSLIDKAYPRTKDQKIDVTKIYISENTYNKMKEHDKQILSLNKDYSEERISKELGMLHFFSGFCVDNTMKDNQIKVLDNHLR